jgi:hypothetical protein
MWNARAVQIELVIAGLDPAIHHFEKSFFEEDGCAGQARA